MCVSYVSAGSLAPETADQLPAFMEAHDRPLLGDHGSIRTGLLRNSIPRTKSSMIWFNVCLSMFERQPLIDALLCPAVENPSVTAIPEWERNVSPKV